MAIDNFQPIKGKVLNIKHFSGDAHFLIKKATWLFQTGQNGLIALLNINKVEIY